MGDRRLPAVGVWEAFGGNRRMSEHDEPEPGVVLEVSNLSVSYGRKKAVDATV
jgi:hypothetical protein